MEQYRTLYRIKVAHDYFASEPCTALLCRLTPQGADLARRRGLLFRQTASDEWTLLFRETPAEDDVLNLDLHLDDSRFTLYTDWKDFHPTKAYTLELPATSGTIEADAAIKPSDRKRAIGSGFCSLSLRLGKKTIASALRGKPVQAVVHFKAPSVQWEYLFVAHSDMGVETASLMLEDMAGKVQFSSFKEQTAYEKKACRTASLSRIPMRQAYDCKLRLTTRENGRQKRVLLSNVPPPELGRFLDVKTGTLRQVCYY